MRPVWEVSQGGVGSKAVYEPNEQLYSQFKPWNRLVVFPQHVISLHCKLVKFIPTEHEKKGIN